MSKTDTKEIKQKPDAMMLVYSTFPSAETAAAVAKELVREHLVGCVNVLEGMRAYYWWDGHINEEQEVIAIFKTTKKATAGVIEAIKARHPHTCPAILAVSVKDGFAGYLQWISESVKTKTAVKALKASKKTEKKAKAQTAKIKAARKKEKLILADTVIQRPKRRLPR